MKFCRLPTFLANHFKGNDNDLNEAFLQIVSCVKEVQTLGSDEKLDKLITKATKLATEADRQTSFSEKRTRKRKHNFDEVASDEITSHPKVAFRNDVYFFRLISLISRCQTALVSIEICLSHSSA